MVGFNCFVCRVTERWANVFVFSPDNSQQATNPVPTQIHTKYTHTNVKQNFKIIIPFGIVPVKKINK